MKFLVVDNFHNCEVFALIVGRGGNKHIGRQIIVIWSNCFIHMYIFRQICTFIKLS